MLQAPLTGNTYRPEVGVKFGGYTVDPSSVTLARELSDSLPGSGSFVSATGTAVVADGPDVVTASPTPWDVGTQWPPAPDANVEVTADAGGGPVPALANGRITSVSGDTNSRAVTVDYADAYEALNRTISWGPLLADMPALTEARQFRHVGLQTSYITDRILRHCGFNATPPAAALAFVSAPLTGSAWPEVGEVTQCGRYDDPNLYPSWAHCEWGVCAMNVKAIYTPSRVVNFETRGIEMTAMAPATSSGVYVKAFVNGRQFVMQFGGSTVVLTAQTGPSAFTELARIPRGDSLVFSARFERTSSGLVRGSLRRADGETVVGTPTPMADAYLTGPVELVHVLGPDRIGGVQVADPVTPWQSVGYEQTAVLYTRGGGRNAIAALPTAEAENCADLLRQQCAAEAATFWIDETGVLRWWDLVRLESQSNKATFTSDEHITDAGFSWSHDLSAVKSRVAVKWSEPAVSRSYNHRIDLWQGGGRTLASQEPAEEWASCPADEVWIMPDLAMKMGDAGSHDFNYGFGTWVAACLADTDQAAQQAGSFNCYIRQVTGSAYKVVYNWTGPDVAVLQTPSERKTSNIWMRRRNMNMPIVRGKAKVVLVDAVTYSAQTGPAQAPEHVIDAGWWIQTEAQAAYLADYAGSRVTVPQPVLSAVSIMPTPGLQLGDMVTMVDDDVTKLTVRGIVVSNEFSYNVDGYAQSFAIRPVVTSKNEGATWEAWAGENRRAWVDFADDMQGSTWEQWGTNPLIG